MPKCMHTVLSKALNWIVEAQQRRTMRELQRLVRRTLIDIGLDPEEIEYIVRSDGLGTSGRRRAVIAKSSQGIMAAEPRILASRPVRFPLPAVLAVLGALSFAPATAAAAETYPAQPIRLIVPFAAGEPNDISARIVADELSKMLGQPVIVENRLGAGGNVAAEAAAKSPPGGHTLFWAQAATHGINPTLYRQLGYDPIRDFASIGLIASEPLVLATNAHAPWTNLDDLVAAVRLDPGRIHFGSGGTGTAPHMAGELLAARTGVHLIHVPYRGDARAVEDAMAGRIQLVFAGLNASLGHIRGGALKALAVTSRARVPALAHVPAIAEMLPDYSVVGWGGIVAPAGTEAHVIARLSQALREIGQRPAIKERFAQLGVRLDVGTPQAMDAFVREQIDHWRDLIEQNGIGLD